MMKTGLPVTEDFAIINTTKYTATQLAETNSLAIVNAPVEGRPHDNHGLYLSIKDIATPFQIMIGDYTMRYIYKRYKDSTNGWQAWFKLDAGHADTWTTARTLTIGNTGKSVDGSANVSWSKDEILGASTSAYFYRGDKTWSNTIVGSFNASSSGSNRANINMVSVGDVPNDFYLGNNNANKWSITSRASNESYNLYVYSTGSGVSYATCWEYSTGKFSMLHGAAVTGDLTVSGLVNSWKFAAVSSLNADDVRTNNGLWAVANSITNAAHTNHSLLLGVSNVGTPFQIQIPDSSVMYIYKRYYSSGAWSSWSKISAGYADSCGNADTVDSKHASDFRAATAPTSGAWFRGTPLIGSDGVMEIGKYIDFHSTNAGTSDFDVRITASTSGLSISGTTSGTFSGNITGNVTGNCSGSSSSSTIWSRTWQRANDCFIPFASVGHNQTRVYMPDANTANKPSGAGAGFMIAHSWDWGGGAALLYQDFDSSDHSRLWTNRRNCGDDTAYTGWALMLDSYNYGSYAVSLSTTQTVTGQKTFTGNLLIGSSGAGGRLNGGATNGGCNSILIGDDVWLGDVNVGGIMGMKSTTGNCGFYMYNSSGTQIGQLYFSGELLVCNRPIDVNRDAYADGGSRIRLTSNGKQVGIHVGSGGNNRGLYDWTKGDWVAYTDGSNNSHFSGNAATASRINGNLGAVTDGNGHNVWISSGTGADGIPKYAASFYYTPSTGTLNVPGNLIVNSGNTTGRGLILSDDGDIVDLNDAYCSMRFTYGVRIFSANKGGSAVIALRQTGDIIMNGNLDITHATSADMAYSSANPKITFSESGTQPVVLVYTDYDSYRAPAGLKVCGNQGGEWFEVAGHIYASAVHNAIWNDYAECRKADCEEPGYVITPDNNGVSHKTTARLMPGCRIISDTWGHIIGESTEAKTPIAVSGRVLAYPYRAKTAYRVGDCVCSAPNGTVDIMTREEIKEWPDRIIGIVNEIPTYDVWEQTEPDGDRRTTRVEVRGRIWIDVR